MKKLTVKPYATFSYTGSLKLPVGDWTIEAQIRDNSGTKYADCVITPNPVESTDANVAVGFVMTVAKSITKDFPVTPVTAPLLCDIFFTSSGGFSLPTVTYAIAVDKNITVPTA